MKQMILTQMGIIKGRAVSPLASSEASGFAGAERIAACANNLTVAEFDPISREPNYKQRAVRIERL